MAFGKPIPGETPIDDVSGLKIKGITTRSQLNIFEAENIRRAFTKYLAKRISRRQAPFDLRWAKKLHKEMFGQVWSWAGMFRTADTNIGDPWAQIETGLYNLLHDLESWRGFGVSMAVQAVRLHHQSVRIHPFLNGNGRWARLLANIWLKLNKHPITVWPEQTIGIESVVRNEYLAAIRAADLGDESLLLELHNRFIG